MRLSILAAVLVLAGCGGSPDVDESGLAASCGSCAAPSVCVTLSNYRRSGETVPVREGASVCLRPAASGCTAPEDRGLSLHLGDQMSPVYCTRSCLTASGCPAEWWCDGGGANGFCAP